MSEIIRKKKRQRCRKHKAKERSWDEYVFGFMNHEDIEVWRCRECKEEDEKWLAEYHLKKEQESKKFVEDWHNYWIEHYKREKELKQRKIDELWDCEVQDTLALGTKLRGDLRRKFKKSIPKEILQLARATIKLQNLIRDKNIAINDKLKAEEEQIKLEQERIEKLKRPLVDCKKHGALFLKDCIKGGKSRWTGEQRYKCRECMSETHKDYYSRKKEYVLKKCAEYRKNNPELRKEIKAKSWRKCNGKNKIDAAVERDSITSN